MWPPFSSLAFPCLPFLPPLPLPSPPFPCSDSPLSPFCHWQPRGVRAPGARPSPPAFLILSLCLFSRRSHAGATVPRGARAACSACPPDARAKPPKSLGETQLAAGAQPQHSRFAFSPLLSSPLPLPGQARRQQSRSARTGRGVQPGSSPQGDAWCPAAPQLFPGVPSAPKQKGPRPER